jgi:hypothetical protein
VARSKVDPERAREQYAAAAFRAYAARRGLNKTWEQVDADSREAWKLASDEVASAILGTLDQEETFLAFLKLAMRDALTEDHISQLVTMFVGPGGLPGKVRLIVTPDRISMPFARPLEGRHDG